MAGFNRWVQRPRGTMPQSQPLDAHSASMLAQAARVPRLANIAAASHAISRNSQPVTGRKR